MEPTRTRTLAAVMFADLVGFTALMGRDEEAARAQRDRQREVVSRLVERFGGRVMQFYGDGTLSLFGSAVEAARCAVMIQTELAAPPETPLRIGIHLGDVVDEGDGVYGDGVNVASRLEALAPSGGVVVSDKVHDELLNHPDLAAVSLGPVRLKNVTRSVEVFALTSSGLPSPAPFRPSGIEGLWSELKRRHVVRVGLIYGAAAFGVLQVADVVVEPLGLPQWVMTFLVVAALAGFPVALILAWAFDLTASGVQRTPERAARPDAEPTERAGLAEAIRSVSGVRLGPAVLLYALAGAGVLGLTAWLVSHGLVPGGTFVGVVVVLASCLPLVLVTSHVQRRVPSTEGVGLIPATARDRRQGTSRSLTDVFTWPRLLLGMTTLFALLGVGTAAYGVMRVTGIGTPGTLVAQGVLDSGGVVVLADFEGSDQGTVLSELVTEAIRIDLAQSVAFELMDPRVTAQALARMVADPSDPFDEDVALELARREGAEAVVSGEVGRVGPSYVLSARIVAVADSSLLAAFRETARDSTELVAAIDGLSAQVRSKIGESLRLVARTEPLESVTTHSLEALRKYAIAARGEPRGTVSGARAIQLLEEAVAIDTTFAQGYRFLAILLGNNGGSIQARVDAATNAFRHRGNLPLRDRLLVEGLYHTRVSGDFEAAERAYRGLLDADSTLQGAATNLADILMYDGQYAAAESELLRNPRRDNVIWAFNYMVTLAGQQRFDEAREVMEGAADALPDSPMPALYLGVLFAAQGRSDDVRMAIREMGSFGYAESQRAIAAAWEGRLEVARRHAAVADSAYARDASASERLFWGLLGPFLSAWHEEDAERAGAEVQDLLARVGSDELPLEDRQIGTVALFQALIGDTTNASAMARPARTDSILDPVERVNAEIAQAVVRVHREGAVGIPGLEAAARNARCARCRWFYLAVGYEVANRPDDAIRAYEAYLDDGFFDGNNLVLLVPGPVVHERLARLYVEMEDEASASAHYERVAALWRAADPALLERLNRLSDDIERLAGNIPDVSPY